MCWHLLALQHRKAKFLCWKLTYYKHDIILRFLCFLHIIMKDICLFLTLTWELFSFYFILFFILFYLCTNVVSNIIDIPNFHTHEKKSSFKKLSFPISSKVFVYKCILHFDGFMHSAANTSMHKVTQTMPILIASVIWVVVCFTLFIVFEHRKTWLITKMIMAGSCVIITDNKCAFTVCITEKRHTVMRI